MKLLPIRIVAAIIAGAAILLAFTSSRGFAQTAAQPERGSHQASWSPSQVGQIGTTENVSV